jgi:hypothetical protein
MGHPMSRGVGVRGIQCPKIGTWGTQFLWLGKKGWGGFVVYGSVELTTNYIFTAATQAAQTITFTDPPAQTYGAAPFTLTATASSGLPVSFASNTSLVCTVSGSTVTLVAVGTCTIKATQAGNADYLAAPAVTQSFTVNKASQTITFPTIPATPLSAGSVTLAATASSGLPVSYEVTTTKICSVSGSTVTLLATGNCYLIASQAGNADYKSAPQVDQTFAITLTPQTISFAALPAKTYGAAPFTVSATASSGLPVSYTSTTTSVCTVSGSTVTLVSAAAYCTIQASQAGNSDYGIAPTKTESFWVYRETQTITFAMIPSQTVGTPLALSATASSGLAVTFTSTTTGVCTVSGTTATFIASGSCTIDANQAGNTAYGTAPTIARTFEVTAN